jgi:hypothetical protein
LYLHASRRISSRPADRDYPLPNLICLLFYTLRRLLHLLVYLLLYLLLTLLHLLLDLFFYSRSASCRAKHRE